EKMDGYGTLSSLRNEPVTASIPFILMTGLADNAGMRHGMELGADDYLPKPFTTESLYAAVDARLKKSQTLREEAEQKLRHLRDNISLMMPHEMRTPLNGILSNAELLAHSAKTLKPGEIAEIGQEIHASSERLARLIENFLIYAQLEMVAADPKAANALKPGKTIHPIDMIKRCAARQAALAGRPVDLSLELSDVPVPLVDEYLIKIVEELIQNAFKFSKPGTPVRVSLSEENGAVVLSVSDQGRGFSPEETTRIDAYMQFDRKMHEQQGLGLGLAIVKRLVELHGATLSILTEKEVGAVISAKFPKTK
ncbi:MAG TPA: ATP-binding protein, partial [Desulfuromonadaceae bacterium]|nr:ATP-binding protein [Desulfuromonadaceae bacterium]